VPFPAIVCCYEARYHEQESSTNRDPEGNALTEAEWLESVNPNAMLSFLRRKGSGRKFRLFACACCERFERLLPEGPFLNAFLMAEKLPDHTLPEEEVQAVIRALMKARGPSIAVDAVGNAVRQALEYRPAPEGLRFDHADAQRAAYWAMEAAFALSVEKSTAVVRWSAAKRAERAAQAVILRDIFEPFRRVKVPRAWLVWNDGTIPHLAWSIYAERAFENLPILADALEDAGCTDEALLAHCRGGGQHVRGCWAVDLLRGAA
jgi:hypothetical protein